MAAVGQELGEDLRGEQEPIGLVDVGMEPLEDLVSKVPELGRTDDNGTVSEKGEMTPQRS